MKEDEETLNELKKRVATLENLNKESLPQLAQAIDKIASKNNVDHLAIQLIVRELNLENKIYGKIEQRGSRFEREPFL
jgi:uncharacterized protein YerC